MSNPQTCPQEHVVVAAIGSAINPELLLHLRGCESCRRAQALAERMRQLATRHIAVPPPDPDVIWVLAQLSKPRTLWTPETISGVAALAASALLAAWIWPAIAGYLSSIVPKSGTTTNVFLTSCVVASAIAVVAARTIRRLTGE